MKTLIIPMIVGGITGGLAVVMLGKYMPSRFCPKCNIELPRIRKPKSIKQALFGGCTCPGCGLELNRKGKMIKMRNLTPG
jgi:hypothetical protein